MKLTEDQVTKVKDQTGLEPYPEDHPSTQALTDHLGEHTFYLDPNGLYVWEEIEAPEAGGRALAAIQLGEWHQKEEDGQQVIRLVEPKPTEALVDLADA
ncbi:MAG TPA: hypothetical protein VHG92_05155 [Afifellaceae bacterium]|nr:hypothetical protein [Afifellaceae bacterium]